MILTSKSITALDNYLWGYFLYGTKDYSDQVYNEGDPNFEEFKWWLRDEPGINMHSGLRFHDYLLEKCDYDEERAFDLFFEKLDKFKELKRKK